MIASFISLISIFIGILGANIFGLFSKYPNFSLHNSTIAGVFGSIFFIKIFGRIGFGVKDIMLAGHVNYYLLCVHIIISFLGGMIGLVLLNWLKNRLD